MQQGCPYEAENISRKIHTIPNIILSFEPSSTLNCSQSYLQGFSFYNRLYLYLILCFSPIFRALLVSLVSVFDESDIPQLMWHGGLSHMFITARLIFIQKNGKPLLKCFILSLNLKYKKRGPTATGTSQHMQVPRLISIYKTSRDPILFSIVLPRTNITIVLESAV